MDRLAFKKGNKEPMTHNNLSKDEFKAQNELKNNDSIVIKKADKGGGLVIMDKYKYIEKVTPIPTSNCLKILLKIWQKTSWRMLSMMTSYPPRPKKI